MLKRCLLFLLFILLPVSASAASVNTDNAHPVVVMETTKGNFTIELFAKEAPMSVDNFLSYVKDGYFNGTIFHRVIPGFMIQGGGFTPGMKKKPTRKAIANEASNGLKNKRGTLSMARTAQIHSATSQFFVNVHDNVSLDHRSNNPAGFGYAVFGKVTSGMDVVDKIVAARTTTVKRFRDVPAEDIVITKAYIVGASPKKLATDF